LGLPLYSVVGVILLLSYSLVVLGFDRSARFVLKPILFQAVGPIALFSLSIVAFLFQGDVSLSRFLGFFVVAVVPLSYAIIASRIDPLFIVRRLILLHSCVFFLQFVLFYGIRVDFDPVDLLSEVTQRGWGGSLTHDILGTFRRFGGLYSEPGTYATFIAPLVAILFAARQGSREDKFILVVGFVSLFLTFSVFAWIFCAIILVVGGLASIRKVFTLLAIVPVAAWLAWPYISYRFFDNSGLNIDSGVSFREDIIWKISDYALESWQNLLLGAGLLTEVVPFSFEGAINDVGLVFYTQLSSGAIGVLFIFSIIFHATRRFGFSGLGVLAIVLSSKVSIFAPMFWLTMVLSAHTSIKYGARSRMKKAILSEPSVR
jgi:hypothetical protein